MMAKPTKALEFHYPMIQFFKNLNYFIFIVLAKQCHEKKDVLTRTQWMTIWDAATQHMLVVKLLKRRIHFL